MDEYTAIKILENFSDFNISADEKIFCNRAGYSLKITVKQFLANHNLFELQKTTLISQTLCFVINNTFLQISNFKKEVEESLKNNYYFSLIFVTFCMLLYHPYDFSISIDDISKLLIEHNYLPEDNCEYFLDHFIKSFSNKPIKKYQLSRIWDILDIFRNLENGVPVPILIKDIDNISNSRYILLLGIDKENAIILDSTLEEDNFICFYPIDKFLNSVVYKKHSVYAWNCKYLFLDN